MEKDSRIFVAGHRGLAGSAICRTLESHGYTQILRRTRKELDLFDRQAVEAFFLEYQPEYVFLAAAKVGGILANNTYPADFISQNLAIQNNVIDSCFLANVKRLLFLGSSCIYPMGCAQPIREEYLLTGPLEPTNRPYAVAKIAGIEMCWSYNRQHGTRYLAAMPTNLYGAGDNYNLATSHVLPALIRKVTDAKLANRRTLEVWGSGKPRREFLFSDDLGEACVFLLNLPDSSFDSLLSEDQPPLINVGTGEDLTIRELATLIAAQLGFAGELVFDASRPDGTLRKLLDVSRIHALGWKASTSLTDGIQLAFEAAKAELIPALI